MDIKFDKKDRAVEQQADHQRDKRRQSSLLVLLLLLLGVVGYLYFFTNLIRPMEPPPKPATPVKVVKKPLPAKTADVVTTADGKGAAEIPNGAPAAGQPATAAKPVVDGKKEADSKAALPVKKEQPAASGKTADKPLQTAAKPAAEKAQPAPTKQSAPPAKTGVTETKQVAKSASPALAPRKDPWLLVAGLYLFESKLAEDMVKLKNAGFNPVVTAGPKKPVTMYRLFFGSYLSREEAVQVVKSLQQAVGEGFMLAVDGVFKVYAGSFAHQSGALSEQQKLAELNVKTSVQKAEVMVASKKLTVGAFADRDVAESNLKKVRAVVSGKPFLE